MNRYSQWLAGVISERGHRCVTNACTNLLVTAVTSLGTKKTTRVALFALMSFVVEQASAGIIGTYVDAEISGRPGLQNTTPGSAVNLTYIGNNPGNLWDDRPFFGLNSAGVLAPTQNVLEGNANLALPTITTTVTGLAANSYDVYVLYWSPPGSGWSVQAKLSTDASFQEYSGPSGGIGNIVGTDTGISQGSEELYEAHIGVVSGTSIAVDISNSTNAGQRTWYDGVAFQVAAPEPSSLLLAVVAGPLLGLVGARCRRSRSRSGRQS